jgi:hypothetical protein
MKIWNSTAGPSKMSPAAINCSQSVRTVEQNLLIGKSFVSSKSFKMPKVAIIFSAQRLTFDINCGFVECRGCREACEEVSKGGGEELRAAVEYSLRNEGGI